MLYIYDHLINAIGARKISHICLLDPSAVFDTTDHNILLICHLGLAVMALLSIDLDLICPFVVFVSYAITISTPYILASVVSHKTQFSAIYSIAYTTLLSLSTPISPPVCIWYTTFPLLPSTKCPLKHHSLTKRCTTNIFLDDCQSSHAQLF